VEICGNSRHRKLLYNTAHAIFMLLYNAMYMQFKYNLLPFHTNSIYTTVPPYHGCKNTAGFFALVSANSAVDLY
jgi:hypothetical protein